MKQVPHWGPTNISRHRTKCSRQGDLEHWICAPLNQMTFMLNFYRKLLHKVLWWQLVTGHNISCNVTTLVFHCAQYHATFWRWCSLCTVSCSVLTLVLTVHSIIQCYVAGHTYTSPGREHMNTNITADSFRRISYW